MRRASSVAACSMITTFIRTHTHCEVCFWVNEKPPPRTHTYIAFPLSSTGTSATTTCTRLPICVCTSCKCFFFLRCRRIFCFCLSLSLSPSHSLSAFVISDAVLTQPVSPRELLCKLFSSVRKWSKVNTDVGDPLKTYVFRRSTNFLPKTKFLLFPLENTRNASKDVFNNPAGTKNHITIS